MEAEEVKSQAIDASQDMMIPEPLETNFAPNIYNYNRMANQEIEDKAGLTAGFSL